MSSGIELYVDNQRVEIIGEPRVTLTYDAESTRSIDAARESQVVEFEVEMKEPIDISFLAEGYLHASSRYNAENHRGALHIESVKMIEGRLTIRSVRHRGDRLIFELRITKAIAPWAEVAVDTLLSESPIDYQMTLRTADVREKWEEDSDVQFFPVVRDEYFSRMSSVSFETVRRLRSIDEYHPFLRLDSLVKAVAAEAGYELVSDFVESEEFKQLYMSGSYVSQNNTAAKEAMAFYVKKSSNESAVADYSGRVTISISQTGSSAIDHFVNIETLESDKECYTRGNCLTYIGGTVQFTPPTSVSVGFEYRVKYTTSYWIESRKRLKAFDTFYFGESPEIKVDILNTFPDERGREKLTGFNYLIVIFDHASAASYRLKTRVNGASDYTTLTSWSERTKRFTTPFVETIEDMVLEVLQGGEYVEYEEDWALYQGYIEESGETEVDVTIRTSPSTISKKRFEGFYIKGGDPGMAFTLLAGTSIRPYFAAYPGYGDIVEYSDIAQHEMRLSDVMRSIQHLFNLRFFTDVEARKLYIEPLDELYSHDDIWDWSERVDESKGITFEDAAIGVAKRRTWGFQEGDGAVARSSPEFGKWSRVLNSYAANNVSATTLNPIFSPSLNDEDGVLIVGNRDDTSVVDTLEFSPRVVYYRGIDDAGEPIVTFHDPDEGVSLCFEDRDGVRGLNRYYESQIEREERGQYVTLTLRLEPHEMVDLLSPIEGRASLLSTFRLKIDGEWAECWIEKIVAYRLGEKCAEIKFLIVK